VLSAGVRSFAPAQIVHADPRTRDVLGYLHGNCAHCHNASDNAMSKLDLDYRCALDNVIGKETEGSGQAPGVRVVPGAPEQSILYLSMTAESDELEQQPMPPIGVQRRDATAIALIHDWIADLAP
jgi:hypothetical protein